MTRPFPLDAEQVVRLVSEALCEVLDRTRPASAERVNRDAVLVRLARATGINLPVDDSSYPHTVLPYGSRPDHSFGATGPAQDFVASANSERSR